MSLHHPFFTTARQPGVLEMIFNRTLLAVAVLLMPVTSHAVTTSQGKSSVFTTLSGTLNAAGNIPTPLTGQILKGKQKTVLKIEATLTVAGDPALPGIFVFSQVNGLSVTNPTTVYSQCDVSNGASCTVTATGWVDIDAAELANPGIFVGQPLNVTAGGGNMAFAGLGLGYEMTFSAIVVKK